MGSIIHCDFNKEYYNYQANQRDTFKCCEERIEGSKFCLFHDENLHRNRDDRVKNAPNVIRRLNDKIEHCISNKEPLICIGYHIPDISIPRDFGIPVYFNSARFRQISFSRAKFHNSADFSEAIFYDKANFSEAIFYDKAIFSETRFNMATIPENKRDHIIILSTEESTETRFSRAKFCGETSFYKSIFTRSVDFSYAEFKDVTFSAVKFGTWIFLDDSGNEDSSMSDNVNYYNETDFVMAQFHKVADFSDASFSGKWIDFSRAIFSDATSFGGTKFSCKTVFVGTSFSDIVLFYKGSFKAEALFYYVIFEKPSKVTFDIEDMSTVSFLNTDITRVKFTERTRWGGDDGYKIIEEEWLEKIVNKGDLDEQIKLEISIESVLSAYRNLRENYEFRLRYDDAGKFFIKEMELRRNYRTVSLCNAKDARVEHSSTGGTSTIDTVNANTNFKIIENRFFRRNISLTGLYHTFSSYGESISKPVMFGVLIVGLSTLFWMIQNDPIGEPSISFTSPGNHSLLAKSQNLSSNTSQKFYLSNNFINATQILNHSHTLKAFERSLADFLPLLSMPNDIKIGVIDFIVKIVGGAVTFVLLGVALRRKFERKYTR